MSSIEKAYKFRIYPNKKQEEQIQKTFGCSRFVFNYYLNLKINQYKEKEKLYTRFECDKDLTRLKSQLPWLKDVDSRPLKQALKDLDQAYQNFYRRVKNGEKEFGFPKFKSKKNGRQSYRTESSTIRFVDNKIKLPIIGLIKCKISRQVEGRILNATVSQNPMKVR